jgi:hypothetical protein
MWALVTKGLQKFIQECHMCSLMMMMSTGESESGTYAVYMNSDPFYHHSHSSQSNKHVICLYCNWHIAATPSVYHQPHAHTQIVLYHLMLNRQQLCALVFMDCHIESDSHSCFFLSFQMHIVLLTSTLSYRSLGQIPPLQTNSRRCISSVPLDLASSNVYSSCSQQIGFSLPTKHS